LGYSIGRPGADRHEAATAFGWGGVGGSHAYADTASGAAFALTKNRLTPAFSAAAQVAGLVTDAVADRT
jgi:CubicO group peptidase (beta-lactamase class C family)